ncbi:outer membrane efflux protein [Oceaniferula spumae]|uniref:Outer membrane efflux protein n=1 Tax=Oceaniferula spumae TaxID=2979115 RepID=A0AAT9FGQ9_9BACT
MLKFSISLCVATVIFGGCAVTSSNSSSGIDRKAWKQTPPWAQARLQQSWWRKYGDASLNKDIAHAFSSNPDLAVVAARLEQANAAVKSARAVSLPSFNLGIGYREGRKKEVDFGPYDLAPWEGGGQLSWEIDLSGRLRAATQSARHAQEAAFWDLHAARLQMASRIAAARFNLYRFNAEISILQDSTTASQKTVTTLNQRATAGIAATTDVRRQQAEHDRFKRQLIDVRRLRDLTIVQLRTLTGGNYVSNTSQSSLPNVGNPPSLPMSQLLAANPTILAAEARVRSAFQLEKSAKLDLLPSFKLNASASGAGHSLTGRYTQWIHQFGPSLDIPIYDPVRLAKISSRRAESKVAAAKYRAAVLTVLEEVDSARINLVSRRSQLAAAQSEIRALATARSDAQAQFNAGLTSQIEFLDTERRWLEAKRVEAALRQSLLNDHIQLMKALGG